MGVAWSDLSAPGNYHLYAHFLLFVVLFQVSFPGSHYNWTWYALMYHDSFSEKNRCIFVPKVYLQLVAGFSLSAGSRPAQFNCSIQLNVFMHFFN